MFLLLFLIFPFAEIYTYYQFVQAYSFLDALLVTLSSGLLGIIIMSTQGKGVIMDLQRSMAQGQAPTTRLMHRAVLMLGGLMFFIPGLLSDAIGVLCILPGTRHLIVAYAKVALMRGFARGSVRFFGAGTGGAGFSTSFEAGPTMRGEERDAQVVDVTPLKIVHENKPSEN